MEYIKKLGKVFLFHAFRLHQPLVKVDFKFTAGRHRHIFSGDKYSPGTLKLVPYTTMVVNVAPEGQDKTPTGGGSKYVKLKLKQKGETFVVTFTGSDNKPSKGSADPFGSVLIVPYWSVQYTSHAAHANMQHSTLKCTMSIAAGKEETADDAVTIPILQNSKVVKEGEELFVSKERVAPAGSIELPPAPDGEDDGGEPGVRPPLRSIVGVSIAAKLGAGDLVVSRLGRTKVNRYSQAGYYILTNPKRQNLKTVNLN